MTGPTGWQRRARPLLGTLVEIGLHADDGDTTSAVAAAFERIRQVQACLSRFEAGSEVSRFHTLVAGEHLRVGPLLRSVLDAAAQLRDATAGVFDITLGTAPYGWSCDGDRLHKLDAATRLDLGGIGKGFAVDCAVGALIEQGISSGWVNAGGDLRAFGEVDLPVRLRDEDRGGARAFASLRDGAFATSRFGPACASRLARAAGRCGHVSVAAPACLWADALTKIVATTGQADHPLLARHGAIAWIH